MAISTYGYCHLTAFTDAGISYISNEFQMKLSAVENMHRLLTVSQICVKSFSVVELSANFVVFVLIPLNIIKTRSVPDTGGNR